MISIIICSVDPDRAKTVGENITATIGVTHELIVIDNAKELGGMGAGYNAGAARATYDTLCFVHDDVEFLSKQWGQHVLDHFRMDAGLGLIGVAGSRYKSKTLSGWWTGLPTADCCNIFQRTNRGKDRKILLRPTGSRGISIPVKTLDGVWLCMRKPVWQAYPFNTAELKGFHFYDLDISLRVSQQYKVAVVYDIDLVHFSKGNFGDEWVKGAVYFHERVNKVALPASVGGEEDEDAERLVCRSWLKRLRIEKISLHNKRLWVKVAGAWAFPGNSTFILRFYCSYIKRLKMKVKSYLS